MICGDVVYKTARRGHFADKRSARNAPTGLKMFDVWPEVQ